MTRTAEFEHLLAAERAGLRRRCLALCRDRDDADDLEVATLAKAWRSFDGYDRSKSFGGWLSVIARTLLLSGIRDARRRPDLVPISRLPQSDEFYLRCLTCEDVHFADEVDTELMDRVDKLPESQREAILMRADGLDYKEIAILTDKPVGTVKTCMWRGRMALGATPRFHRKSNSRAGLGSTPEICR